MTETPTPLVIIVGASVRSAAFSALRAGLTPWSVDLFGDVDLTNRGHVHRLDRQDYPDGLADVVKRAPLAPWMYTGALENRPEIVRSIAGQRVLWGNNAEVLARVRSPRFVRELLTKVGLPCPDVRLGEDGPPRQGRWLVKPLAGAGGAGIRLHKPKAKSRRVRRPVYWQQHIDGEACAAIYLGDGSGARLLGVTRQLVGEAWLHAARFRYCGSIGPLPLTAPERLAFEKLGMALTAGCGLRGLFGVDCICRDGVPWPVEVNPRYTASVEVLEYALKFPAMALHRQIFDPSAAAPRIAGSGDVVGKAILFARQDLNFPAQGPWTSVVTSSGPVEDMPAFADIPQEGEVIPAGKPILSFFARGDKIESCRWNLEKVARRLAEIV